MADATHGTASAEARRSGLTGGGDGATAEKRQAAQHDGRMSDAGSVALSAKTQLATLTGHSVESVVGLERHQEGWRVTLDVLELEKVPCTADILATYQVDFDDGGELRGYRRVRRFVRGQADLEDTHES